MAGIWTSTTAQQQQQQHSLPRTAQTERGGQNNPVILHSNSKTSYSSPPRTVYPSRWASRRASTTLPGGVQTWSRDASGGLAKSPSSIPTQQPATAFLSTSHDHPPSSPVSEVKDGAGTRGGGPPSGVARSRGSRREEGRKTHELTLPYRDRNKEKHHPRAPDLTPQ